jgi:ATP-binding cassette subfamily E protein 1
MFDEPSSYLDVKQRLKARCAESQPTTPLILTPYSSHAHTYYTPLILTPYVSRVIRSLLDSSNFVIVVEHDLSVIDYLSDFICVLYGVPGA